VITLPFFAKKKNKKKNWMLMLSACASRVPIFFFFYLSLLSSSLVYSPQISSQPTAVMTELADTSLTISKQSTGVVVEGKTAIALDYAASNGVFHGLASVSFTKNDPPREALAEMVLVSTG
jgi:hypothetical protein